MITETSKPQAKSALSLASDAGSVGIAELSKDLGITPRTLRFYEDKGLIAPTRQGGVRTYSPVDRARIENILRVKRLGFTLDDIREVLEVTDGTVTDRAELARRQSNFRKVINRLQRQRRDIDIVRQDLNAVCDTIEDFLADPSSDLALLQHAEAYDAVLRRYLDEDDHHPQLRSTRTTK